MNTSYLVFTLTCFVLNTVSALKWHIHREYAIPAYCVALDFRDSVQCQIFAVYGVYQVYKVYLSLVFAPKVAYLGGTL